MKEKYCSILLEHSTWITYPERLWLWQIYGVIVYEKHHQKYEFLRRCLREVQQVKQNKGHSPQYVLIAHILRNIERQRPHLGSSTVPPVNPTIASWRKSGTSHHRHVTLGWDDVWLQLFLTYWLVNSDFRILPVAVEQRGPESHVWMSARKKKTWGHREQPEGRSPHLITEQKQTNSLAWLKPGDKTSPPHPIPKQKQKKNKTRNPSVGASVHKRSNLLLNIFRLSERKCLSLIFVNWTHDVSFRFSRK